MGLSDGWRPARALLPYYLGFVPLYFALASVEGAAHGDWQFTRRDLGYQLGAYAAFYGGLLLPAGLIVVPLTLLIVTRMARPWSPSRRALLSAVAFAVSLLASHAVLGVLSGGSALAGLLLLQSSGAFLLSVGLIAAGLELW